jgi:hypothetical protein
MFPEMSREQVQYVAETLRDVLVKEHPEADAIGGNGSRARRVQTTERALAR